MNVRRSVVNRVVVILSLIVFLVILFAGRVESVRARRVVIDYSATATLEPVIGTGPVTPVGYIPTPTYAPVLLTAVPAIEISIQATPILEMLPVTGRP